MYENVIVKNIIVRKFDCKKCISHQWHPKQDLQKMTSENIFSQPRMRVGLARLIKYFHQNQPISQLIEYSLTESEKYPYIPEVALLWRHKGRFPAEYFWQKNINRKITIHRNNQIVTVNIKFLFVK